jgi:hypothetical protein
MTVDFLKFPGSQKHIVENWFTYDRAESDYLIHCRARGYTPLNHNRDDLRLYLLPARIAIQSMERRVSEVEKAQRQKKKIPQNTNKYWRIDKWVSPE